MNSADVSFESMVETGWSFAVFEAAHRFCELRPIVLAALRSPISEVRSAAVATLNEANDQDAHDQVLALIEDPDHVVREEVLEYLTEFAVMGDSQVLLSSLKQKQHLFHASRALKRLHAQGPQIHEDDDIQVQESAISEWEAILGL